MTGEGVFLMLLLTHAAVASLIAGAAGLGLLLKDVIKFGKKGYLLNGKAQNKIISFGYFYFGSLYLLAKK